MLTGMIMAFVLNVSPEDVQVLGKALGELPYKEAAPIVRKLDEQLREQQKPQPPHTPAPLPDLKPAPEGEPK